MQASTLNKEKGKGGRKKERRVKPKLWPGQARHRRLCLLFLEKNSPSPLQQHDWPFTPRSLKGQSQVESGRARPSQAKSSRAKPSQVESGQVESGQAKPSQAKPSQAKPSRARPSRAKLSRAKPSQAKSGQAEPSKAKSSLEHGLVPAGLLGQSQATPFE